MTADDLAVRAIGPIANARLRLGDLTVLVGLW